MNYNPMSIDDYDAIRWLEEESHHLPALENAWKILKAYYEECKKELKNMSNSISPFESFNEKERIQGLVSEIIRNDSFMTECEEFLGVSRDEIKALLKEENLDSSKEWILAKVVRLYNMHLKLGHSARITYVAEKELESIPESKNSDLLKRTVLLSSLLHDVGRFYQAAHYNDLADSHMKMKEKKINGLDVDHAIAGYYYSLASAFELHKLGVYQDDEEIVSYITEAIASVVVKCHQKSNSSIPYFDYSGGVESLNQNDMLNQVFHFMNGAYDEAKLMNFDVQSKIDPKHKAFIDQFVEKIKTIMHHREIDYSIASGFDVDTSHMEQLYSDLNQEIQDVLGSIQGKKMDDVSDAIVDIMNRRLQKISKEGLKDEEKESYKQMIEDSLRGMLDYDVASSIEEIFQRGERIPEAVRFLISSSMSMTMDADKIDILNQRALGIYNTSYQPSSYEIFPPANHNLVEILNQYFQFSIDPNHIIIDDKVRSVLQRLHPEVKEFLESYMGNFNLLDEKKFPKGSIIEVQNGKILLNGEEYQDNKIYDLFHEDWTSFVSKNMNLDSIDFKEFKKKYFYKLQLSISNEIFEDNMKDYSFQEKEKATKKLLVSDGLKERFMLEGNNRIQGGWINDIESEDSDHLVNSSVSGLLWQLNQFLFVNMRNKHSYEFIEKFGILDQIYEQYQEKSPVIASIIKEYIDYSKGFIHYALQEVKGEMLTSDMLDQMRKDYFEKQFIQNDLSYQSS